MIAIKIVLILAIAVMFWAFRNRSRVGLRAGARVAVVLLALLAAVSIIQPSVAQRAADAVGVTRGTDLLLYLLVMVFSATSLGFYFRFRELERRLADLTRAQAIREAVSVQGLPSGAASRARQPDGGPPRGAALTGSRGSGGSPTGAGQESGSP